MKLSRLYTNLPDLFPAINFRSGLNAVLAVIKLPENKRKDTHNLGKSTLIRLIDFCFLSKKKTDLFLFKHADRFADFVFFLEIETAPGHFLTIRRSVAHATQIAFKHHAAHGQDFSALPLDHWDHIAPSFDKARELLDSFLGWTPLSTHWSYRQLMGYLLRSQDDYQEVFQLRKFVGRHKEWKPFLARLLGFDDGQITALYEQEDLLEEKRREAQTLRHSLGFSDGDLARVEGVILVKERDIESRQKLLDTFDFNQADFQHTQELVSHTDVRIAELNQRRYTLVKNQKKIEDSLGDDDHRLNVNATQQLFEEAGVLFPAQLKQDFEQLLRFNQSISEERTTLLREELQDINKELQTVNAELVQLSEERSQQLKFLAETDVFDKYKAISSELTEIKASVADLHHQKDNLLKLDALRKEIQQASLDCEQLRGNVEANVCAQSDKDSLYSRIRIYFDEIIEKVIDRKAILSVSLNNEGHLEFKAEILDTVGNATSADAGHTYRKLLCVAFDLAILRAHLDLGETFPRFVFHDGIFETLDNRKKENLLAVLHQYADLGLQPVVTAIDSDLPPRPDSAPFFSSDEIILSLDDQGDNGRLFKMPAW